MKIKFASNRKEIRNINKRGWWDRGEKLAVNLTSYYESLIPDQCFQNNSDLEMVVCLPMTQIFGKESFQHCNHLRYIDAAPSSVGDCAFQNCTHLKEFNFSALAYIGMCAFENTGLENVNLKNAICIPDMAFANCFNLRQLSLGNAKKIGDHAFINAMIQRIVIPDTIETIGKYAFANNTFLNDIIFTNSTPPEIDPTAFENCSAKRVWVLCQSSIDDYKKALPVQLAKNIHEIQKPIDLLPILI